MAVKKINQHIQEELKARNLERVTAPQAAEWLDQTGLLKDSRCKRGALLRKLLRKDEILGGEKISGKWYIYLAFDKAIPKVIERLSNYEELYMDNISFDALKKLLDVHPEAFITRLRIIGEKLIKTLAADRMEGFDNSWSFFETTPPCMRKELSVTGPGSILIRSGLWGTCLLITKAKNH